LNSRSGQERPKPAAIRALQGVRARLFAYSVVLLAIGIAVTVFTGRQILLVGLDSRIGDSLLQEVREFKSFAKGAGPRTGLSLERQLQTLFDLYLERNVLEEGEQLLTFTQGRLYRDKDTNPDDFRLSSRADLTRRWGSLTEPQSGGLDTPSGPVRYLAVPMWFSGVRTGTFVVAKFTARERDEIADAVRTAGLVGAVVLLIGTAVAYLAAGRLLYPLRELTETARNLESSDLTRRIDVHGDDELAELSRTFNAMLDRLETAFSSQRDLIRDVSHELRTPITIVRGHLELMGDDPVERRETLELVTDELDRMARLVDDLLTLARAERPDFLQPEPVRLADFTHEVYSKATSLGDRRWTLHLQRDGSLDADPQRLTQALVNLADNAVKQTEAGAEIEIGADVEDGWARFWVADGGPGLAEPDRNEVFARFARGEGGKGYAGTGLGLAIVKAVADAHGGWAEVDSEPGAGARFTVWIPSKGQAEESTPTEGAPS
jgi:two-component system, OmpR family, sensor kinase